MVLLGTEALIVTIAILFGMLFFLVLGGLTYVSSLVDVYYKSPEELPSRDIWLIFLLISPFFLAFWLIGFIYFFKYNPPLVFWKRFTID